MNSDSKEQDRQNLAAYIGAQFDRLEDARGGEFLPAMQIRAPGGQTNWLNVTWEQLDAIKAVLMPAPEAPRVEVSRVLTLSTAHVLGEVAETLASPEEDIPGALKTFNHIDGYGAIYYVQAGAQFPDWFEPIAKLAADNGCDFVRFDADGPVHEKLLTCYELA